MRPTYLSGRLTPQGRPYSDLKRPASARGLNSSPRGPRSRPGSSLGRPSTPSFRPEPYTGTIRVSIRPNPHSVSPNAVDWVVDEACNTIEHTRDKSLFSFDNVFAPSHSVSNLLVYQKACAQLVSSFLNEGYNGTLFAYGMTGSGKTYSMRGEEHDPGFVRLAIEDIFAKIEGDRTRSHDLSVSYLEIYNEKISDLLSPGTNGDLKIRDDPQFGTRIVGITALSVLSKEHLLQLILRGDTNRKTSATDYNARSSRSHAILQLRLRSVDAAGGETCSTLSMCDLAGSERATSSLERRKEGAFINKSLLALLTVINKLSQLSASATEHIPYRDSKLTRLLQPALSGNSLVLILCTVHLGAALALANQHFVTETYNTLRFAARASNIVMTVKSNERAPDLRAVEELRRVVEAQKQEIALLRMAQSGSRENVEAARLSGELVVLHEKIAHLTRLNDLQKTETVLLRNDALNDILGVNTDKNTQQTMMANLEEFSKRVNYEAEEQRLYILRLENQLRAAQQQLLLAGGARPSRHHELLVAEQEEEIRHLRETIKDKDHIIQGLTKTSKLRRLVDSNSAEKRLQDKENVFPEIREFYLSPKAV